MKRNLNEVAVLAKILHQVIRNQQVMADLTGVILPFPALDHEGVLKKIYTHTFQISPALRCKMLYKHCLEKALSQGLLREADGRLVWTLQNQTLLAYFMGRLFCNDQKKWVNRTSNYVWVLGKPVFPTKEIQALFGPNNLRDLRRHRELMEVPVGYEIIDQLFEDEEIGE